MYLGAVRTRRIVSLTAALVRKLLPDIAWDHDKIRALAESEWPLLQHAPEEEGSKGLPRLVEESEEEEEEAAAHGSRLLGGGDTGNMWHVGALPHDVVTSHRVRPPPPLPTLPPTRRDTVPPPAARAAPAAPAGARRRCQRRRCPPPPPRRAAAPARRGC